MKSRRFQAFLAAALCGLAASTYPLHAGTISNSVKGALVSYQGGVLQPVDESKLSDVKFFAIYYSAHWCGPCRQFTPQLVEFYNRIKKDHPEFELIFVSSDRSPEKMVEYMKEANMPWPAVAYDKRAQLRQFAGSGIPCLVAVDANGTVLADSFQGEQYLGPEQVMTYLEKRLQKSKNSAGASAGSTSRASFDDFFKKKPAAPGAR